MYKQFLLSIVWCALFASCGRKQRTIFQFNEQESVHINRLVMPAVQELTAKKTDVGVLLTWQALGSPLIYKRGKNKFPVQLLGYSIFKLSKNSFIPKKPLNKKPITTTTFTDTRIKDQNNACYLVRPLFNINGQSITGISSSIASVK